MRLNRASMLDVVRCQLAVDMNCRPEDFLADGIVFCEAACNEGRRMYERPAPYLEAATMGKGIVVCADAEILPKIRQVLEGRDRDDLFSAPFFYGHSLYYVPDSGDIRGLPCPQGFTLHTVEGPAIHALYDVPGFRNALQYDPFHPRPDVLVVYAACGEEIAGMAGASADCGTMWQIGIDVKPPFRGMGLAACLVSILAEMTLDRGIVPFYGTASSNVASQMAAHRSGFAPAWMCTYRHVLDGKSPYEGLYGGGSLAGL